MNRLLYMCYYSADPVGGIKKAYEHVDWLNQHGYSAYVVHNEIGYRYPWYRYADRIPVLYLQEVNGPLFAIDAEGHQTPVEEISKEDILVIPEPWSYKIFSYLEYHDLYGVIFNQNAYYTFRELHHILEPFSAERDFSQTIPYLSSQNLGTLVVSKENRDYLTYAFPEMHPPNVVRLSCDPDHFHYHPDKKAQIAYMPRKSKHDVLQVVNILRSRNSLEGWQFVPIEHMDEDEVARVMRESAIFMSFSHREGFGLPPQEAMACGCLVIGYHGQAGKEFLKEPYAYPIAEGEIISFAKKVEEIALDLEKQPEKYMKQGKEAAEFIQEEYAQKKEKEDLMNAWKVILERHSTMK